MNTKAWLALAASLAALAANAQSDRLTNDQKLNVGQSITSNNRQFYAVQQSDGNLCVYRTGGGNAIWCHMKYGANGPYYAVQQSDGNLCTYKTGQQGAVWCHMGRGVPRQGSWVTIIQDDANLCTYPTNAIAAGSAIWCTMKTAAPMPSPVPAGAPQVVGKFAPFLKFDGGAGSYGYPMSADTYYKTVVQGKSVTQMQNTDPNTIKPGNKVPIYYTMKTFGGQVRIRYWIFYGYQAPCININGTGSHNGDWEDITVILKQDQSAIAAVQFGQHGGRYMRISGPRDAPCSAVGHCDGRGGFELYGTHPVAYIGRTAHGTFHDSSSGLAAAPGGSCTYYGDSRNGNGPSMETWGALTSLDGNAESWLAADRQQNFPWGPDGVNTHPTMAPFPTSSCTGDANQGLDNAGCFKSECLSGDDSLVGSCLKECRSGFTNTGLTCTKFKWGFIPLDTYGRLNSGNWYGYSYGIPQTDAGIARRRNTDLSAENNLP